MRSLVRIQSPRLVITRSYASGASRLGLSLTKCRARLRESAGSIELLGDPSEVALEPLLRVAKQRFGTRSITLLGPRKARERLAKMVAEQGLEIGQERER
jgi:hypothetical protein